MKSLGIFDDFFLYIERFCEEGYPLILKVLLCLWIKASLLNFWVKIFSLNSLISIRVSKSGIEYPITREFSSNRVLGYSTKLLDTRTRVINWKFTKFSHNFRQIFSWKILISKYFLMNIHWKTIFLNFNIRFKIFNNGWTNHDCSMDTV
jgi:hypothetical protein